jgi:iron complex outermembrane recepter protein
VSHRLTRQLLANATLALCSSVGFIHIGVAQQTDKETPLNPTTPSAELEEVTVTATKRVGNVSIHDAPLAVTAFGENQLDNNNVTSISDLTKFIPNVFLNSTATFSGVNNFTIRGMGVYDTIPSDTPTVGVFVDGVYIGAGAGTGLNTFDNGSMEVLRGPQGLLFGRNVTAGAIVVNTTNPTDTFHADVQASVETDPNFTESTVVSGPIISGGTLDYKLAVYRNDDTGNFTNLYDGQQFGASRTTIARGALSSDLGGGFRTMLKYEHGDQSGQGPAVQNQGVYSPNSFDFESNIDGFSRNTWDQLTSDSRWKVAFGNGEIVNIAGWRQVSEAGLTGSGTAVTYLNFGTSINQHQYSDELRYAGNVGPVSSTVGLFYYQDSLAYVESRALSLGTVNEDAGGIEDSRTYAAFSNFDIALPASFTLNLGARYSSEHKSAEVEVLSPVASSPCSIQAERCSAFDFIGADTWYAFTPKVGLEWTPDRNTHLYTYWTKGFRSGGYDLRQTVITSPPGPYAQEVENTYEIGLKQNLFENSVRVNLAVFDNEFHNLQRGVSTVSPTLGTIQTVLNAGDTTIRGAEAELAWNITPELSVGANAGYLHNHWDKLDYNFLGSGPVTEADYRLQLPFLSPWSYGINGSYAIPTTLGQVMVMANFTHRDATPSVDSNLGWLKAVDDVDAGALLKRDNHWTYSLYGKNLTNQATTGYTIPYGFLPHETASPLNKGRIVGVKVQYDY